jgi:general stress protein YciG
MAIRIAQTETEKPKPKLVKKAALLKEKLPIETSPNQSETPVRGKRGFGSMDTEKRRLAQSKGGASVAREKRHFAANPEKAREAGRKGGQAKKRKAGQ